MEFVLVQSRGKSTRLAGVQAAGDSVSTLLRGVLNQQTNMDRTPNHFRKCDMRYNADLMQ